MPRKDKSCTTRSTLGEEWGGLLLDCLCDTRGEIKQTVLFDDFGDQIFGNSDGLETLLSTLIHRRFGFGLLKSRFLRENAMENDTKINTKIFACGGI